MLKFHRETQSSESPARSNHSYGKSECGKLLPLVKKNAFFFIIYFPRSIEFT